MITCHCRTDGNRCTSRRSARGARGRGRGGRPGSSRDRRVASRRAPGGTIRTPRSVARGASREAGPARGRSRRSAISPHRRDHARGGSSRTVRHARVWPASCRRGMSCSSASLARACAAGDSSHRPGARSARRSFRPHDSSRMSRWPSSARGRSRGTRCTARGLCRASSSSSRDDSSRSSAAALQVRALRSHGSGRSRRGRSRRPSARPGARSRASASTSTSPGSGCRPGCAPAWHSTPSSSRARRAETASWVTLAGCGDLPRRAGSGLDLALCRHDDGAVPHSAGGFSGARSVAGNEIARLQSALLGTGLGARASDRTMITIDHVTPSTVLRQRPVKPQGGCARMEIIHGYSNERYML